MELATLVNGTHLLESGQGYTLEPGEAIRIHSGTTTILLQYSYNAGYTVALVHDSDRSHFSGVIHDCPDSDS